MSKLARAWMLQSIVALVLMCVAQFAQAAISCTISSSGINAGYTTGGVQIVVQSSFSVTCVRGTSGDPTSTTYAVRVNNGLNPVGPNNRAQSGANLIRYDFYVDSGCGTQWKGTRTIPNPAGTINLSGFTPTTVTQNFWMCIPAGQTVAAGTYTDTVIMTPTYSAGVSGGTGTIAVTIISPPTCTISTAPGNVSINYTAFQGVAATGNTSFGVTCSNGLPYTMSVSPASGTLVGVNYSLSLPGSSTATGFQQNHTITGTAASGQAGTCAGTSCSASQVTTLTVTY